MTISGKLMKYIQIVREMLCIFQPFWFTGTIIIISKLMDGITIISIWARTNIMNISGKEK